MNEFMMRSSCMLLVVVAVCVSACSKSEVQEASVQEPTVYTVNYPLAAFAERIAGDAVVVVFPDIEGDPAFWKPKAEDVSRYQEADLILLNGASYAKWVSKVSLSQAKLVDTSAAYRVALITEAGDGAHRHGPGDVHAHGTIAFTTWLDLNLALQQASAIRDAFSQRWPAEAQAFSSNYQALEAEFRELDHEFEATFRSFGDQPVIGSHPVYQYLSRQYGLNMRSLHWEPDVEPDAKMWQVLERMLEVYPAKLMFWEGAPLADTQQRLERMGIQSVVFNPCGNRPAGGDFFSMMRANIQGVRGAVVNR